MYSTAPDLARFLIHMAGAAREEPGSVLRPETLRQMLQPQIEGGRFGLGATLYGHGKLPDVWFGHEGMSVHAVTFFMVALSYSFFCATSKTKTRKDLFSISGSNKGFCLQALANTRGNGMIVITNGDCTDEFADKLVTELISTILTAYGWVEDSQLEFLFPYRYTAEQFRFGLNLGKDVCFREQIV